MKYVNVVLFILFFTLSAIDVHAACWKNVGEKDQMGFGSDEQVKALQSLVKTEPKCATIGISWRLALKTGLVIDCALIYEKESKRLWRVKIKNMAGVYTDSVSWLGWTSVTDQRINHLQPPSGFELDGQASGKGAPQLQALTKKLLKANAPKPIVRAIAR